MKILGLTLDKRLTYEHHAYKGNILPHLEYCGPLLLGIGKGLNRKLESGNHYALKTLFNMGKTADYDTVLKMASVRSLQQRRFEQSLIMFFKCSRLQGPSYISDFFKIRTSRYNLRNTGLNLEQARYNTLYLHNSYSYIISHTWNELPNHIKNSDSLSEFCSLISNIDFTDNQSINFISHV